MMNKITLSTVAKILKGVGNDEDGFFESHEFTIKFVFAFAKIVQVSKTQSRIEFLDADRNLIKGYTLGYTLIGFVLADDSTSTFIDYQCNNVN